MLKRELDGMKKQKKSNRFSQSFKGAGLIPRALSSRDHMWYANRTLLLIPLIKVFYVEVLEPLDPVRIVHYIMEQTEKNAKCPFRYLRRIVPMMGVTNATLPSLKVVAEPVVAAGFSTPENTQFKVREGIESS